MSHHHLDQQLAGLAGLGDPPPGPLPPRGRPRRAREPRRRRPGGRHQPPPGRLPPRQAHPRRPARGPLPTTRQPPRARRRPPGQALRPRRRPARTQPPRPRLRYPGRAARRSRRSRPSGAAQAALHRAAATLGAELATEAASHPAADANPDQVLAALHQALADRGYEPYDDPDGTIRLRNCPFDRIATHHRELVCGANHAMLQALTDHLDGDPPIQAMLDPQPGRCCVALRRVS